MAKNINWWNIIAKLRYDKSYWHYLEPAEIMEIVQRIKEAKEKIIGLEKYIHVDLRPALTKLNQVVHLDNYIDLNRC
ncbi:hypothetical protein [Methanobacterium sp. ACI-7]|uniref:hypothetical protein n=1 Tax=unclassified Methanobacterium TaxID=2627676 RepID=UPI0039C00450